MKVELRETCEACPEAYNAYINGEIVGHLRLRWGNFTVTYGTGELVYSANPPRSQGIFDGKERDFYLNLGCRALIDAYIRDQGTPPEESVFTIGEPETR